MRRALLLFLTLVIVLSAFTGCGDSDGTTEIKQILRNPTEWEGEEVTVVGRVGMWAGENAWYTLTDENFYQISLYYDGPELLLGDKVKATGIVEYSGWPGAYIRAESVEYVD